MQPKVSVIVPVYKVDRYLTQCLNSIVNQTLKDIEIIIIDEGEKDRCRDIIDFFEKNDNRIVAPHKKNGGYGASCNYGFKIARGEYIAIVESDDWIDQKMYEEMYDYAKKLDADVVKTPYYEYFSDGRKFDCVDRKYMADVTPQNSCFSMKEFGNMLRIHASLWAGLYKTEYLRKNSIHFIEAKGGAYVDVGFRIDTLINSDKIAWLDKPFYNYRVDAIGSTTNSFKPYPMILRWREVHEKFSSIQEDYDVYYGKYLIFDEFLNTINRIGYEPEIKFSRKEIEGIVTNFNFVKESTIFNAESLSSQQKWKICFFKKHPYFYKVLFNNKWLIKSIQNKVLLSLNSVTRPIIFFILVGVYLLSIESMELFGPNVKKLSLGILLCIFLLSVLFVIKESLKKVEEVLRNVYRHKKMLRIDIKQHGSKDFK